MSDKEMIGDYSSGQKVKFNDEKDGILFLRVILVSLANTFRDNREEYDQMWEDAKNLYNKVREDIRDGKPFPRP